MKIDRTTLTKYLRESLFGQSEPSVVNVNPVVDQSAALTDPTNTSFTPQTNLELLPAIQNLIQSTKHTPEEIYELIKNVLSDEEGNDMKNEKAVEEAIRQQIRSILVEAPPPKIRDVSGNFNKFSKKKEPAAPTGDLPPVTKVPYGASAADDPRTPAGERREKNIKNVRKTLSTMNPEPWDAEKSDKPVRDFDVSSYLNEFTQGVYPVLSHAVLEYVMLKLNEVIKKFNSVVEFEDEQYPALESFSNLSVETVARQFKGFLDAFYDAEMEDEKTIAEIESNLEKVRDMLLDPRNVVYAEDGESINTKVKIDGKPLRGWLIETGKSMRGDINVPQDLFVKSVEGYFRNPAVQNAYGLTDETVSAAFEELVGMSQNDSPSNRTNKTLQKLVIVPFLMRFNDEVESVQGMLE